MTKLYLFLIFSVSLISCNSQELINSTDKIEKAKYELAEPLNTFFSHCLLTESCDNCIEDLIKLSKNDYQTYIIAGSLFDVDPTKSFELHKKAYQNLPNELNFNLEYAIENHRRGDYETAIKHYELYKTKVENDFRINVWLSECYLNIDQPEQAIKYWKLANHPSNHTGIDRAIYVIHGKTDQLKTRSELIKKAQNKDAYSAYQLLFIDLNWEIDWYNSNSQDFFVKQDLETIGNIFKKDSQIYSDLSTYVKVKKLSKKSYSSDSIKTVLNNSKIILDGNRFPSNGNVTSDLLRISLLNSLVSASDLFTLRGEEILNLSDKHKDGELLNIYAYLEAQSNHFVSEETDKKGWKEYKDERFAVSYFIGLAEKNNYNNPDLVQAIKDFPESSEIQWVKLNCAKIEGIDIKNDLILFLKKEFKSLQKDRNRYSYALNQYFALLEKEI